MQLSYQSKMSFVVLFCHLVPAACAKCRLDLRHRYGDFAPMLVLQGIATTPL